VRRMCRKLLSMNAKAVIFVISLHSLLHNVRSQLFIGGQIGSVEFGGHCQYVVCAQYLSVSLVELRFESGYRDWKSVCFCGVHP
jgi:hypothetical protein